jgi:3-oxoacyl-(acyl-carrier-protein) synthase
MSLNRVVITGIGPLSSVGIGKDACWEGMLNNQTGVQKEEYKLDNALWAGFYKHKIKNFDIKKFGIDEKLLNDLNTWLEGKQSNDLFYLMAAVKLALDDSGLNFDNNENDVGLVLTHENPGHEQFFTQVFKDSAELSNKNLRSKINMKEFFETMYEKEFKLAYDLQTFMFLFQISKIFGIHGYSLFINNACASGLYAIETASQMIKSRSNNAVIIAAADNPGIYKYLWFKKAGLYADDGLIKPFAKDANGLVFGDGAVGLVLESLEHARKRNAHIYAEYLGGGFALEGWKVTLPFVESKYFSKAILQAIKRSSIKTKDIDLVCAHGVGNSLIDRYEAKAITDIFGEFPQKPLITTFKPYLGHSLGASALLETAILLLCMEKNMVLPVLNLLETNPKIKINLVKEKLNTKLKVALKVCSAFAGYDGAVVLKKL